MLEEFVTHILRKACGERPPSDLVTQLCSGVPDAEKLTRAKAYLEAMAICRAHLEPKR